MNVFIYQKDFYSVYRMAIRILDDLGYSVLQANPELRQISVFKDEKHLKLIDLKFNLNQHSIEIIVLASQLSIKGDSIQYDGKSEEQFFELLVDFLNQDNAANAFHLSKEDYLLAC